MLAIEFPELADRPARDGLEDELVPGALAEVLVQLLHGAVPVAPLEPLEEVPRGLVPGVPRRAAPFDPVWRRVACAEAYPVCNTSA